MLAILAVEGLGLMPPIVSIGRSLDFVPRTPPPPRLTTFGVLHAGYSTLELCKIALGIYLACAVSKARPAQLFAQ